MGNGGKRGLNGPGNRVNAGLKKLLPDKGHFGKLKLPVHPHHIAGLNILMNREAGQKRKMEDRRTIIPG
jgi:hypothetical protein